MIGCLKLLGLGYLVIYVMPVWCKHVYFRGIYCGPGELLGQKGVLVNSKGSCSRALNSIETKVRVF